MTLVVHGYNSAGMIEATIGKERLGVPDDMANTHRQMIAAWEAEGNTIPQYEPPAPSAPDVVTMRQARLALSRDGKLVDAEAAIAAMTGSAGEEARIEWEYATTLRRDHPLVASLGPALGYSDADLDSLFTAAAAID